LTDAAQNDSDGFEKPLWLCVLVALDRLGVG